MRHRDTLSKNKSEKLVGAEVMRKVAILFSAIYLLMWQFSDSQGAQDARGLRVIAKDLDTGHLIS